MYSSTITKLPKSSQAHHRGLESASWLPDRVNLSEGRNATDLDIRD